MENIKKIKRDNLPLDKPNCEGNVWPRQYCPAFTPRGGSTQKECWYCIFADFHLDKPQAVDVGVCYYPNKMN
ncbi:hypothetical protein [Paludicola sp. MB14-C6]|uniref:hypothetical protein n=1 Tax=Paludihabitans sp. MB14-C6 TaxID=3070656 RepID=UPI0035A26AAB